MIIKKKFVSFEIKGFELFADKLKEMSLDLPEKSINTYVRRESVVLSDALKNAFQPYVNTGELQRSISIYKRKKKDQYFTYYVGPQYSGNKSQQDASGKSAAGNAAHFLEYGTVDRYVSNKSKGGVSFGKGRQYGAKSYRGRVAPIGLIRRTVLENNNPIAKSLALNISKALLRWYKKNGLSTKKGKK